MRIIIIAVAAALASSGCESEQERKLDKTVKFVESRLGALSAKRNAADKLALGSTFETGGDLVDYLILGVPENAGQTMVNIDRTAAPWTVVVHQAATGAIVVDAYGDDGAKPQKSVTLPAPNLGPTKP